MPPAEHDEGEDAVGLGDAAGRLRGGVGFHARHRIRAGRSPSSGRNPGVGYTLRDEVRHARDRARRTGRVRAPARRSTGRAGSWAWWCSRRCSPSPSTTCSSAGTRSCATTRVLGHMRFALETVRPELQQYFIERNFDGRPFDRDTRTVVYERAKGIQGEKAYGTELDVYQPGYEWLVHSAHPVEPADDQPRVRVGGPDCTQPYDMALLNVSAMSFGALSANALRALNGGAAARRLRARHRRGRPDEVPPRARRRPRLGDRQRLLRRAHQGRRLRRGRVPRQGRARPRQVRVAQAQPGRQARHRRRAAGREGHRGDRRGARRAAGREVREPARAPGVLHPARAGAVHRPHARAGRRQADRLQALRRRAAAQLLAVCKAMVEEGITPDFIVVDGGEGGTGAAPRRVRGPRRHAAHRGPDDRAQRARRHRAARPHPDRRQRQGRDWATTSSSASPRARTTRTRRGR